jgi:ankyrin repeat protein
LNNNGNFGFHIVCQKGYFDIAKIIIDTGTNINTMNNNGSTGLYFCCQYGHINILKLLIDKNVDINIKNNDRHTGLYIASRENNLDIVKLLIANGADINLKKLLELTPFHIACMLGNVKVVKYLIRKGVDITQETTEGDGINGFYLACANNKQNIIELLTDRLNRVCIVCNKPSRNRCKNCEMRYCSSECQLIDWKKHKTICIKK